MIEVRVDFNARGERGLVKASQRRANGELHVGDKVLAVDKDEDLTYVAVVDSVDPASGRVWLEVHWEASTEPEVPANGRFISTAWSFAAAQVVIPTPIGGPIHQPATDSRSTTPSAIPA